MRREVDELIEALSRSGDKFDKPPLMPVENLITEAGTPSSIGGYTLVRLLGRGGMGAIYLGESEDADPPRVAIKLIDPDLTDGQRFDRERNFLARLQHPNIARLLDEGRNEGGREYLVMELVEGVAIDRHCERAQLSLEARLELFQQVCAAVHYAHQNLVIHLDLKPGNVLVTEAGVPKLVDFGISANLADGSGSGIAEDVEDDARPLTPTYASPEQLRGEVLTTASDVYSLGVLLYLLLTGNLPHPIDSGQPTPTAERGLIRPSESLDPPLPFPAPKLSRCGLSRRQLRLRLQGDLDSIILTAMSAEPADRYGSVERLSEEIGRHLESRPILARRQSFAYVAGKFLRRHRMAATITSVIVLLSVFFAFAASWQIRRVGRERDLAALQRQRAEQVSEFMVGLFELVDPIEGSGDGLSARQVIDLGATRLADSLDDQPMVKAELNDALGRVYLQLGMFSEARKHLELALRARKDFGSSISIAESLLHLAEIDRLESELERAEARLLEALEIFEDELGSTHPSVASANLELGNVYQDRDDLETAESFFRKALALKRQAGAGPSQISEAVLALAQLFQKGGRYEEAKIMAERSLELLVEAFGEDHVSQAATLTLLGEVHRFLGEFEQAKDPLRRAIALYEKHLGPEHIQVAWPVGRLGVVFGSAGQLEEARPFFERGLAIHRAAYGDDHPLTVQTLHNLAVLEDLLGRHEAAIGLYLEVLERFTNTLGPESSGAASVHSNLATLYREQGAFDLAEVEFRKAIAIWEPQLGPEHTQVINAVAGLGSLEFLRGNLTAAKELLEPAVETYAEASPDHPDHALSLRLLGLVDLAAGRPTAAEPKLQRAREILLAALDPLDPYLLDIENDWARLLGQTGRSDEARKLLRDVVARASTVIGAGKPNPELVVRVGAARLALHELEPTDGNHLEAALVLLEQTQSEFVFARLDFAWALWHSGAEQEALRVAGELRELGLSDQRLQRLFEEASRTR